MVTEPGRNSGLFRPIAVAALVLSWAIILIGGMRMRQLQHERDRMADREARAATEARMQRARAEDREQQAIEAVKRFRDAVAEDPALRDNPDLALLREKLLRSPGGRPDSRRGIGAD